MSKLNEFLTNVDDELRHIPMFLIGTHRVSTSQSVDHSTIVGGLSLFCRLLIDCTHLLGHDGQVVTALCGRLRSAIRGVCDGMDLTPFLNHLDDCDQLLLQWLAAHNSLKEFPRFPVGTAGLSKPVGVVIGLIRNAFTNGDCDATQAIKLFRSVFCFLKKLDIDRPDLTEQATKAYWLFEDELDQWIDTHDTVEYREIVSAMNDLAVEHTADFATNVLVPRHGPGAVSDARVKCWFDKNKHLKHDRRIDYLLGRNCLGTMSDYCWTLCPGESTRTSRFVCVPKTWKKLRGISAEPVELQYFQQAILRQIDTMFTTNPWWRSRVNLHSQSRSRRLAKQGSRLGDLATVDLSAASDSVTTVLVKDVLKGTPLLPWLLGTRSTHTECDGIIRRISKFAPMGSACCFPVECMIFTLAAEVAVARTYNPYLDSNPTVCVFGDDIILNAYAYPELLRILAVLGFSINEEKSFTSGFFRESCGCDAYKGVDVTPLRFRTSDVASLRHTCTHEQLSRNVAFSNECFHRGFWLTRAYLLRVTLKKVIKMKRQRVPVRCVAEFGSVAGTGAIVSVQPTNYNVVKRYNRNLWRSEFRGVIGKNRPLVNTLVGINHPDYSSMKYLEWLLNHQVGACIEWDVDDSVVLQGASDIVTRVPKGYSRVAAMKWRPSEGPLLQRFIKVSSMV